MVTGALVGLVAGYLISAGPQAVVDGNSLSRAVRLVLEAHIGALSSKSKFKLTRGRPGMWRAVLRLTLA